MKKQSQVKPKVLQTFKFYDYSDVFIDYQIITNKYSCAQITKMVGVKPEFSHDNGDKYIGRHWSVETKKFEKIEKVHSFGAWRFSTKGIIKKKRFENHAQCLLRRLQKNKKNIKKLLKEGVPIQIFVILKIDKGQDYYGLGTNSKLLRDLLEYSHYFDWDRGTQENFRKNRKKTPY